MSFITALPDLHFFTGNDLEYQYTLPSLHFFTEATFVAPNYTSTIAVTQPISTVELTANNIVPISADAIVELPASTVELRSIIDHDGSISVESPSTSVTAISNFVPVQVLTVDLNALVETMPLSTDVEEQNEFLVNHIISLKSVLAQLISAIESK